MIPARSQSQLYAVHSRAWSAIVQSAQTGLVLHSLPNVLPTLALLHLGVKVKFHNTEIYRFTSTPGALHVI